MIVTWCSPRSFCEPSSEEQIPPSSLPPGNSCLSSDCLVFFSDCPVFVGFSNSLPGAPLALSVDVRGLLPDRRVVFRLSRICMFVNYTWGPPSSFSWCTRAFAKQKSSLQIVSYLYVCQCLSITPGVPLALLVDERGLLPNRRVVSPAVEIHLQWEDYLNMSWRWLSTKIKWNTNTWHAKR